MPKGKPNKLSGNGDGLSESGRLRRFFVSVPCAENGVSSYCTKDRKDLYSNAYGGAELYGDAAQTET